MDKIIYLVFAIILLFPLKMLLDIIFELTHTRPLTPKEVEQLGIYRRKSSINKYYSFITKSKKTSRKFRRTTNPDGKYYKMEIPLSELPAVAASLLQNKKYEWRLLAFEKDQMVDCIYINKGEAHSVSINEDIVNIFKLCDECEYTTIFDVHNHPSGVLRASEADLKSCQSLSQAFDNLNMNFLGFIVSNNSWKCYYKHFNINFKPVEHFINQVEAENDRGKENNILLHKELRKLRKRYRDS